MGQFGDNDQQQGPRRSCGKRSRACCISSVKSFRKGSSPGTPTSKFWPPASTAGGAGLRQWSTTRRRRMATIHALRGPVRLKRRPALPGRAKGVLDEVLGFVAVADHAIGHAIQRRPVVRDHAIELRQRQRQGCFPRCLASKGTFRPSLIRDPAGKLFPSGRFRSLSLGRGPWGGQNPRQILPCPTPALPVYRSVAAGRHTIPLDRVDSAFCRPVLSLSDFVAEWVGIPCRQAAERNPMDDNPYASPMAAGKTETRDARREMVVGLRIVAVGARLGAGVGERSEPR